jgi:hypothetical protein
LIEINKLNDIKRSTFAIGLGEENKFPSVILGTGFFVSSDALIMSAAHVFEACITAQQYYDKTYGKKLGVVAGITYTTDLKFHAYSLRIGKVMKNKLTSYDLGYVGPQDFDMAIAQLEGIGSRPLAFLDPHSTKANLYEEVAMCGYPQGNVTFSFLSNAHPSGFRVSPILQFGHISGFMPHDDADIPYGIQTDIIGTGGSSGSPIVNMNGDLLGIAQQVLSAELTELAPHPQKNQESIRFAKIGITYGLFNVYFPEMLGSAREMLEKGVAPKMNLRYTGLPDMETKVI